jgi:multidrug efflux pump subunit AcrA (membrane-fusion protein)
VAVDGSAVPVKGTVREIVAEVDPLSRSQKVKIRLETAGVRLLPGTYGRISVEGDSHDSVWVPESAVIRIGQQELVQVVQAGRVIHRIVRTGAARAGQVEIISGLGDGEMILVEPVKEG